MPNLWVTPEELDEQSSSPFAPEACETASYLLWAMSGRRFSGLRTTSEIYECNESCDGESSFPVWPLLRAGHVYNVRGCGVGANHDHLRLRNSPVHTVVEVRLSSGVILTPESYWVENRAYLALPLGDYCDAQVTYVHGAPPPVAGKRAARYLAQQLCLASSGDESCELPENVTSVTRQGVSISLMDNSTVIDDLRTGVYAVDLFLKTTNPDNARLPARVFTPDRPRARRVSSQSSLSTRGKGAYDLRLTPGVAGAWHAPLAAINAQLLALPDYRPLVQISGQAGATTFTLAPSALVVENGAITCHLSAADTSRAQAVNAMTFDLYAVAATDATTSIHLFSAGVWLS